MVWLTQPRRQLRTPGFFYLKAKIKKNKINKKNKRTRASLLEKKMTRNIFIFLPGLNINFHCIMDIHQRFLTISFLDTNNYE